MKESCNEMFSFAVQIPVNGKSSGPPLSLCLASLSLCCSWSRPRRLNHGEGFLVDNPSVVRPGGACPVLFAESCWLVGCGVCEVAKLCLKVFVEGSSVDGEEVAGYSVHRCRWSHSDIELCDDTHMIGLQCIRHFS